MFYAMLVFRQRFMENSEQAYIPVDKIIRTSKQSHAGRCYSYRRAHIRVMDRDEAWVSMNVYRRVLRAAVQFDHVNSFFFNI